MQVMQGPGGQWGTWSWTDGFTPSPMNFGSSQADKEARKSKMTMDKTISLTVQRLTSLTQELWTTTVRSGSCF